ncbi:FAD-dependent oxidoreductase [Nonomuraea sp. NPDC050733]|uniref:FAD-dependent oxidoreductase n=1 Tax=Nonomuraea sp. NPDC050733 TaxID=3154633 RepID=UPI0033C20556
MTEAAPALRQAEIVVHGATSGGVRAAVAAARLGLDAVLVEPGRHVGGMTSGGLGRTDVGDPRVLGGCSAGWPPGSGRRPDLPERLRAAGQVPAL